MSTNKRPRKQYRPRPARTPSLIYRVTPEMTEKDHRDIDLMGYIHLDNIRRGEGTDLDVAFVQSAVRACWVLAVVFVQKTEIQRLCKLSAACLYAIKKIINSDDPEIEPFLLEAPQAALEAHSDMARSCDRATLVRAARANYDMNRPVLDVDAGTGFVIDPDYDPNDETTKGVAFHEGVIYQNGALRHGHLRINRDMERYEFYAPAEDVTVPITQKTVLLLDQPLSQKKLRKLKACWES